MIYVSRNNLLQSLSMCCIHTINVIFVILKETEHIGINFTNNNKNM